MTDPFKDISLSAVSLATDANALRIGSVLTYNSIKSRVTAHSTALTRTLKRITCTIRKETSMTYA
jgi:hypothetical protein